MTLITRLLSNTCPFGSLQQQRTFTSYIGNLFPESMFFTLSRIIVASVFPILIIVLATILNKQSYISTEKLTPFECGFDPFSSARIPFSLRFFILAVIFLIFDIEIALLIPAPLLTLSPQVIITGSLFITILVLGLYHEWKEGSLDWF